MISRHDIRVLRDFPYLEEVHTTHKYSYNQSGEETLFSSERLYSEIRNLYEKGLRLKVLEKGIIPVAIHAFDNDNFERRKMYYLTDMAPVEVPLDVESVERRFQDTEVVLANQALADSLVALEGERVRLFPYLPRKAGDYKGKWVEGSIPE